MEIAMEGLRGAGRGSVGSGGVHFPSPSEENSLRQTPKSLKVPPNSDARASASSCVHPVTSPRTRQPVSANQLNRLRPENNPVTDSPSGLPLSTQPAWKADSRGTGWTGYCVQVPALRVGPGEDVGPEREGQEGER
ncbi:hypothetical protein EYF80_031977 [Liparis tanakae]|uniref:Uncharacterized protein n=1 Tax=Liparis tanakae TaxID=230148 RepID=A0A4Z2GYE8_9TELE|nr:hypothetical protein EYF80_031977 [Liparis tanakae]